MRRLKVCRKLGLTPINIALMHDFVNFCADSLPITGDFIVEIVSERGEENGIRTTAAYFVGQNKVIVFGKNRALVDVLRSVAHEMTHMMQDETGLITGPVQDAGGFHEDQANSKAGEIIKLFAKSTPVRKRIYESFKRSNLILG
jgi:hypothetical protein